MQEQQIFDEKNLAQDLSIRQDDIEAKQTIEKELELEVAVEQKKKREKEYQELTNKINIIKSKQKDLTQAKEYFTVVEEKGLKNKKELQELEQFNYDEALHVKIQKAYDELTPKHRYVLSLETELKRVPNLTLELQNNTKQIAELSSTCKGKEKAYKLIDYDEASHKTKLQEHNELQIIKETKITELNNVKVKIAKCEGEIKTLNYSLDNNQTQLKKYKQKKMTYKTTKKSN